MRHVLVAGFFLVVSGTVLSGCGGGPPTSASNPANNPAAPPLPTPTFAYSTVVSTLADSGAGSLRNALVSANALHGTGTAITFTVNGVIVLASALPQLHNPVVIDATTAPTASGGAPVVEVNFNGNAGLVLGSGSGGSQVLGLALDNAAGAGVTLNAGSITLNRNYIGLNLAGAAFGNSGDGIAVSASSSSNIIGLNASGASGVVANVISANSGNGISFHGSSGNTVVANRIGTNPSGLAPIGNGGNGIWMTALSGSNTIGGTVFTDSATGQTNNPTGNKGTIAGVFIVPPLGNLISGNGIDGILIDAQSQNNVLNGNFIGTTQNGDGAMGNAADGVHILGADNNSLIGCQFVNNPFVYYNVLDGNGLNGLHVTNSNNVLVQANFFGTGANNLTPVPNRRDGILIDGSSQNTQVGGVIPLGNVSAGNGANGIEVMDTASGFQTFNTFGGLLAFAGALPNGNDGVLITSTGGNNDVRTNVLSGNVNNGLEIAGDASGVTVDPNIMGLTTIGNALLPNGNDGLLITGTAHANTIGGYLQSVIPENTFSGNVAYGIAIMGQAHDNQLFNNYVGTNVMGLAALPNGQGGIFIGDAVTNTLIGGTSTDPSAPSLNLVSGNGGPGITLGPGTSNSLVLNNWIGLDRAGLRLLPNSGVPILVLPGSSSNVITGNVTALDAIRAHNPTGPNTR
jgi:hypothetical protein